MLNVQFVTSDEQVDEHCTHERMEVGLNVLPRAINDPWSLFGVGIIIGLNFQFVTTFE